jgi:hypothetical protein
MWNHGLESCQDWDVFRISVCHVVVIYCFVCHVVVVYCFQNSDFICITLAKAGAA